MQLCKHNSYNPINLYIKFTRFDNHIVLEQRPLILQNAFIKYIHFLYWAIGVSSSGASGDIGAVTVKEKAF